MYSEGRGGLQKDNRKAFELFERAAANGDKQGMLFLADMYSQGTGVPQDQKQAMAWLDKIQLDKTVSAEALFKANATPAMLDIYNQLPADQKRAMEVQAVLNHAEVLNQIATSFIKWDKETLMATARNLQ